MKFITPDHNNSNGCAATHKSGWWYNNYYRININKQPPSERNSVAGNLLFTEMKMRSKDNN